MTRASDAGLRRRRTGFYTHPAMSLDDPDLPSHGPAMTSDGPVMTSDGRSATPHSEPASLPATGRWVHTWVAAPQPTEPENLPPAPFTRDNLVLADATLRQTVRTSVGGRQLRLRISNAFGGADLPITAVSVALPGGGRAGTAAIEPGSARTVTFGGRPSVVVPVGAQVVSDPLDFVVAPRANLTVTIHLAEGQPSRQVTSHPGARTTSYLLAGNHVNAEDLPGATPVDHWYFLSGLEVPAVGGTAAVIAVGDSLTDGRGSTTNGNDRWPDRLADRLHRGLSLPDPATRGTATGSPATHGPATQHVAVLNQGIGGNRVLRDGLGPSLLARLDRDVLAVSGARWLVVFAGVNDIGTTAPTAAAQQQLTDELIAAYQQIVVRAHAQGIRVYGATLTPFGGSDPYDDPAGHREAARQAVNRWIRSGGRSDSQLDSQLDGQFDAVLDFDRAVRDPAVPRRLLPAYDVGDRLHLNPIGYQALADAVPVRLFA